MTAFEPIAEDYDAYRPEYPDEVYDAIEAYAGALTGRRVLDIAAGTGIATRALVSRQTRVLALDLGIDMLRVLLRRTPDVAAVVARGEALPVRDGAADVVTCATAWHWLDQQPALAGVRRVLRPGGVLAVWGALAALDSDDPLAAARQQVYEKWQIGRLPGTPIPPGAVDPVSEWPKGGFTDVTTVDVVATREVTVAHHVAGALTHSPVLVLGPDIEGFRQDLFALYADRETVVERILCWVNLARKPVDA
jgi:SAM-dependent methyltransferase